MNNFETCYILYEQALARGQIKRALEHLDNAIDSCRISRYIEDMGRQRADLVRLLEPAPRKWWQRQTTPNLRETSS